MFDSKKTVNEIYYENFTSEKIDSTCKKLAQELVKTFFYDKEVTNEIYEKEIFKVTKQLIIQCSNINDYDNDVKTQLSIIFFKKNFRDIFLNFSEVMLEEIGLANEKVIKFLKYYSLDIIISNNKKFVAPQMLDENEHRWNVTSMFTILKTHIKVKKEIEFIETDLSALENKAKSFYKDDISPLEYNNRINKEFKNIDEEIQYNEQRISILRDSLHLIKDEAEMQKIDEQLDQHQTKRLLLRNKRAALIKDKIKQLQVYEYEETMKKIEEIQRATKAKYVILNKNQNAYEAMKNALMKALISKKQPL